MHIKKWWQLIKDTASAWLNDKASRLGAALAYYSAFSLAPLLVIIIAIAGLLFGRDAVQGHLAAQLQDLLGEQTAHTLQSMVASASKPGQGVLATALGIIMLVFGAMGLFGELQDALNTIWEVQPKPGGGILSFLRERFLSLSMVLGCAFLLLVSLVISTALAALAGLLGDWQSSVIGHIVSGIISFLVITLLFAMIYRYLPDAEIAWKDVWLGAAITALLFTIGKYLIGLYLGRSSVTSAYGAAGSFAILLIWLYYSGQIFLFGAEFTKVYADKFGSRIVPAPNAEPVTEEARAQQGIPRSEQREKGSPPAGKKSDR